YLTELRNLLFPSHLSIMQSSALTVAAAQAADRAVNLLLSGPAGGLSGSLLVGRHLDRSRMITFDMGGTSTDVALMNGEIRLTNKGRIADFPVAVPMADIHTIGAGGGSIAYIDEGGLLQVGPASAGADPGPACYNKGGNFATVTDANLILGRLKPDAFLGGKMRLLPERSAHAMTPLAAKLGISIEELAFGIIRIANEHMIQALRVISIQEGFDPRAFTLACFGGAGGLHFCDLAEALEMTEVIVPIHSGVLSALGMLATRPGRELVRTHRALVEDLDPTTLEGMFSELERQGRAELKQEGVDDSIAQRSLDLRYLGQTFTISVPFHDIGAFHKYHERQYGHTLEKPVEILNLRVHLEASQRPLKLPRLANTRTTP
ncbi:MAG: hydantoinase/oxoprolinase family protein, partial [Pseudohongiellaceae bacterium]